MAKASFRSLERTPKRILTFWFCLTLCLAPSIGDAAGKSTRTCLSPPKACRRRVSFRVLRLYQPVDAASIVLAGKASSETRRAAIAGL
jgi:hypothetical protein